MRGAGAKTELVTIERETRVRRAGGGEASAWAPIGSLWAEVRYVRGGESDRQGAMREIAVYRFLVVTADAESLGITLADRIVWNGGVWNIRERPRRLPRLVETEIIAEQGAGV